MSQLPRTRPVPALDGLRGVAVFAVLLFHGGVSWLQGGFLGVDLFFVLSGFLITALLLAEVDGGADGGPRIDLRRFWIRRAKRLLPALMVLIAVIVLVAAWHAALRLQPGLRASLLAALFYVANWYQISAGGDYFTRTGPPSPVQHTWSLAIEEQFYLLWPLVLLLVAYLVLRRRGAPAGRFHAAVRLIALGGTVVSAVLMALLAAGAGGAYDRVYYGTDTRAQSLLVGAALATVVALRPQVAAPGPLRARSRAAGLVAAAVLVVLMITVTGESAWMYRGGFLLAAVAGGVVIWSATTDTHGGLARALSVPLLRALGRISYGVYLWHWPLFLALTAERTGSRGFALLALRIAATITVATLSYVLVEQPIRAGRVLVDGRRAARIFATTALLLAAAGLLVVRPQGAISLSAQQLLGKAAAPTVLPSAAAPTPAPSSAGKPTETLPARTPHAGATRLLVLGDSVAQTLFNGMPTYPQVQVTNRGVLGCGLLQNSPYRHLGVVTKVPAICASWPSWWKSSVDEIDPDVVAVLVGRWEMMDRIIAGQWHSVGDPVFDQAVLADLNRVLPQLTAHGARVALLTPPYFRRTEKADGSLYPEDDPKRVDAFTKLLRTFAAQHPVTVELIEFGKLVSPQPDTYSAYVDGIFARYDGVHITPQAATYLAPKLLPQLIALDPRTVKN